MSGRIVRRFGVHMLPEQTSIGLERTLLALVSAVRLRQFSFVDGLESDQAYAFTGRGSNLVEVWPSGGFYLVVTAKKDSAFRLVSADSRAMVVEIEDTRYQIHTAQDIEYRMSPVPDQYIRL